MNLLTGEMLTALQEQFDSVKNDSRVREAYLGRDE